MKIVVVGGRTVPDMVSFLGFIPSVYNDVNRKNVVLNENIAME